VQPETPSGETPVVTDPKTNATPTVTQPSAVDAQLEKLRKEAEQATMRANQLANQLKAKEDAEAAAKAAELAEQNKFKDLYEQEKAKRLEVETAQAEAERKSLLKEASDKLFAQYPEQVKSLAEKTGMTLTSADEDDVAAFKARLDEVSTLVKQPKVTANNPGERSTVTAMAPMDLHAIANDPKKFEEYLKKNNPGVAAMMKPAE
jgi:vacuolar-type H+-ATPase subunit E/Vma4